jgi:hypothetical protein
MANYSALTAKHAILGAGVADTVTLTGDGWRSLVVVNRDTTAANILTVSYDGTANPATPTALADNFRVVRSGERVVIDRREGGTGSPQDVVVRIVSATASPFSVELLPVIV